MERLAKISFFLERLPFFLLEEKNLEKSEKPVAPIRKGAIEQRLFLTNEKIYFRSEQ
jgi:hypothetical protein